MPLSSLLSLFSNSSKDGGWGGRWGARPQKDPKGMKHLIPSWEKKNKQTVLVYPRVGTTLWNRLF